VLKCELGAKGSGE